MKAPKSIINPPTSLADFHAYSAAILICLSNFQFQGKTAFVFVPNFTQNSARFQIPNSKINHEHSPGVCEEVFAKGWSKYSLVIS